MNNKTLEMEERHAHAVWHKVLVLFLNKYTVIKDFLDS